MNARTLVAACATACATLGLATASYAPAHAVLGSDQASRYAATSNPCDADSQAGGPVEKVRGPGPDVDSGYSLSGGDRSGYCVKVVRPQQDGDPSHTVVIKSGDQVQRKSYGTGHSKSRMAYKAGSQCHVTVWVKVDHPHSPTGVYKATVDIAKCTLYN